MDVTVAGVSPPPPLPTMVGRLLKVGVSKWQFVHIKCNCIEGYIVGVGYDLCIHWLRPTHYPFFLFLLFTPINRGPWPKYKHTVLTVVIDDIQVFVSFPPSRT